MKPMRSFRVPLLTASFSLVAAICFGGQTARDLIINGQVATSDLKVINGRTYVPLADVAKALNMTLVNKANSIEMVAAGGAGPVAGLKGKLGDTIFTGKWKFTVVSIEQMDSYKTKYEDSQESYTPRTDQETLYVVNCRIKNAQTEVMEMVMSQRHCGKTAIADNMEHSFAPMAYDAHNETGPFGGPKMLPGSAAEFSVIFSAPKGTVPNDLLFTIVSGKDLSEEKPGKLGTDLRISLKQ